ncbi:MAG TPA: hypothetical protein VFW29_10455 [Solirubrobacteraceae bacterium]|nr:hypothetical protein [Solirubrobacteraceae bacterium]
MASSPPKERPHKGGEPGRERSPREAARTGAMLVIAVLATLFAVLNLKEVKVDWIVGSGHAPLIVVIVISALAGIVLTYLAERRRRR